MVPGYALRGVRDFRHWSLDASWHYWSITGGLELVTVGSGLTRLVDGHALSGADTDGQ